MRPITYRCRQRPRPNMLPYCPFSQFLVTGWAWSIALA
jgi:hypothetical protein